MTPDLRSAVRTAGREAVARTADSLLHAGEQALERAAGFALLLDGLAASLQRGDDIADDQLVGHCAVVTRRQPAAIDDVRDALARLKPNALADALAVELERAATEAVAQVALMAAVAFRALDGCSS